MLRVGFVENAGGTPYRNICMLLWKKESIINSFFATFFALSLSNIKQILRL